MEFEWDLNKAASNLRKHGARFAEAVTVFEDIAALTMSHDEPDEERFLALGTRSMGRLLMVVYPARGNRNRIVSARRGDAARALAV